MSNFQLLEKIDAAIAEKNLLKHPFYQDWQAGKLSRESLQLYAAQYYRHVEAFPKHLRVLAARADESLKPVVLENLAEEENPDGPHPKLWREFAAALGVSEEDILNSPSLPGTQNVVHTFREICGNRPVAEAVAALYAYEAQVPGNCNHQDRRPESLLRNHRRQRNCLLCGSRRGRQGAPRRVAQLACRERHSATRVRILASTNEALNALWGALDAVHSGSGAKN